MDQAEWLETDGLGGYAMGQALAPRSRRYHALLCTAAAPPTDRRVLVNGLEVEVVTSAESHFLSTQRYAPDIVEPDGARYVTAFAVDPWPRWRYRLPDGLELEQEIFMTRGQPRTAVRWRLLTPRTGVRLRVRPLVSNRDHHQLHHENPAFHFALAAEGAWQVLRPYTGAPAIAFLASGAFAAEPLWYRHFLYLDERERGLPCTEDLAAPGLFTFDLTAGRGEAALVLATASSGDTDALALFRTLANAERDRRARLKTPHARAAEAYLARRSEGQTVIAGYPWFTDWGRDTFISLRGFCLAQGRFDEALQILRAWAQTVDQGMVPNRFPDAGGQPEFNAVDASLWFVVVVGELFDGLARAGRSLAPRDAALLSGAVIAILEGYQRGTRHAIHVDTDGLVGAGEPGLQLTWMDAKVGDWVVTPRIGKPVEVQALWFCALQVGAAFDARWRALADRAEQSFLARFPHPDGHLKDVVDVDHVAGQDDPSVRPNQIFALGGLPRQLVKGERAQRVLAAVEAQLLTPFGLRTLSPADPRYRGRYAGEVRARDGAYHQGTAWPWLLGPFVEALLRVRGRAAAIAPDRLSALRAHALGPGHGHLPEIADGDAPHTPRGCPFQAWSLAEWIRAETLLG